MPKRKAKLELDWTCAPDGRSNSSEKFDECVNAVQRLILDSAFDLIRGNSEAVARLIVAQLAHVHGLVPKPPGDG